MAVPDKTRWKAWADELRQEMMVGLTPEVTKTVDVIASETGTSKGEKTWRSAKFWKACKSGKSPNDFLSVAGFEVDFEEEEKSTVREVTLKLNQTWMSIMQRVLDRQ